MNKYIELAKKLKALADKGIGGEKINAEKMLNDLLQKHNLTIEDIEDEKLEDYYFNVKKDQSDLLNQIVKRVNYSIKCYKYPKKIVKQYKLEGSYMISCTVSEYIEIEAKFEFYQKLYKEEIGIFYTAFLTANDLLVSSGNPTKAEDLSPEDHEKFMRSQRMSNSIKKGEFRKQLSVYNH